MRSGILAGLCAALFHLATSTNVLGANIIWTNSSGSTWNTAANWSPNQVPGASDSAYITNSGTYTVTVSTVSVASNVLIGAPSGTQTLTLAGGSLNSATISTRTANGVIALAGGTIVSGTINLTNGIAIAVNNGTLDGVTVNGTLDVGNLNNGASLRVVNGLVLNGTALVGHPSNGNYGGIGFAGTQTLSGNGTVVFGNNSSLCNVLGVANDGTALTIGAGITFSLWDR